MYVREWIQRIETAISPSLALSFDHSGLQLGPFERLVRKVMIVLDLDEESLKRAIQEKCELIICHHPLYFLPVHSIDFSASMGQVTVQLIQNEISVYAIHTPIDIIKEGICDLFIQTLGISSIQPIQKIQNPAIFKFQVFVPQPFRKKVIEAIDRSQAGWIGGYSTCTFSSEGLGTFRPGEKTRPFIGSSGNLEEVEETKIETIVSEEQIPKLLREIRAVHPYEEIAYDLLSLTDPKGGAKNGIGRYGHYDPPKSMREIRERIHTSFSHIQYLRMYGKPDQTVRNIAVCNGSGSCLIDRLPPDTHLFITSDLGYHQVQNLLMKGIFVILMEHDDSEQLFAQALIGLVPQLKEIQIIE